MKRKTTTLLTVALAGLLAVAFPLAASAHGKYGGYGKYDDYGKHGGWKSEYRPDRRHHHHHKHRPPVVLVPAYRPPRHYYSCGPGLGFYYDGYRDRLWLNGGLCLD